MNMDVQDSSECPGRSDAGAGEVFFGVMFLGFALIARLGSIWGTGVGEILLMAAVLLPAWCIGRWISVVIQTQVIWPRAGYAAPRRDNRSSAGDRRSRRAKFWWILLVTTALASMAIGVMAAIPKQPDDAVNILGIALFAGLLAAYAFWFCFNGWREFPWKWLVLLFIAGGYLAIGLPVRGDYFAVWPEVMLFTGIVWLASGGGTVCSYLRYAKLPTLNEE